MSKVWLELKYGEGKAAITICRLTDQQLLRTFKRRALQEAKWNVRESQAIDPVIGLLDKFDADKLEACLELLIPSNGGAG